MDNFTWLISLILFVILVAFISGVRSVKPANVTVIQNNMAGDATAGQGGKSGSGFGVLAVIFAVAGIVAITSLTTGRDITTAIPQAQPQPASVPESAPEAVPVIVATATAKPTAIVAVTYEPIDTAVAVPMRQPITAANEADPASVAVGIVVAFAAICAMSVCIYWRHTVARVAEARRVQTAIKAQQWEAAIGEAEKIAEREFAK